MNPKPRPDLDRDAIIEQLSRLDSSDPGDAATDQPPSTVREMKAELETLVGQLREPAEPDPFADETGLRRAQELVLAIGMEPDVEARDHRAELGRIGPYELLEKLGEGGMGAVYKALHSSLEKIVALKVLPRERLTPQAISRFKREMKAVGKLDHPNIVRATDAGEAGGDHFLVMEYVEGVDLAELLRRVGPLPAAEACELVRQAAIGLQHAHQRGMVHRDIKPNNIMLAWSDEHAPAVKILDMGLALLEEQTTPAHGDLTTTGQMMGTLEYMSPEQGLDTHNVDIRADIYSLGATLHKLLCGRSPFSGERYNTPGKLMVALATETPPSIGSMQDDLPAGLISLVDRMLSREVADRPATPAEVAQALSPFSSGADLRSLAVSARQYGSPTDNSITPTEQYLSSPSTGTRAADHRESIIVGWDESSSPTTRPAVADKMVGLEDSSHPTKSRPRFPIPQSALRNPKWLTAIAAGLLALAAGMFVIIKISTPDGDYVIQTDDPDFTFSVSNGNVTLNDRKTKREYTMKVVREDDGAFLLDVTDVGADLSFKTKEFTIERRRQVALKTHFERNTMPVADGASGVDAGRFSLAFDGTSSHVSIPTLRRDDPGPVTIEAWVQADRKIGSKLIVTLGGKAWCSISVSDRNWFSGDPSLEKGFVDTPVTPGWVHLAYVRDEQEGRLYLDGVAVDHSPRTKDRLGTTKDEQAWLGAGLEGDLLRYYFQGLLHEVRISDVARYTENFAPAKRHESDKNTLALYHCDAGEGEVLEDSSGNGHHGQIIGAEWVKSDGSPISPSADPDRRAAEFVLSIPRDYQVLVQVNDVDRWIGKREDLPVEPFRLTNVNVEWASTLDDAGLANFRGCRHIKVLSIHGTQVTEKGLANFQDCLELRELYLTGESITDAALELFKDRVHLTALGAKSSKVTDVGVAHFQGRTNLTKLHLPHTRVTDLGLAYFKDNKKLTSLSLGATRVTDAGLAHFADCPDLELLELFWCPVSDAGLAHFKRCQKLKRIDLAKIVQLSDDGLDHLASCQQLIWLNIRETKVTEAGVMKLSAALPGCKIEWDGGVIEPQATIDAGRK